MKFFYFVILIFLFGSYRLNAQIVRILVEGIEKLTKSATEKTLTKEIERLSLNRIKIKTEQEASNFIKSNSLVISETNVLRFNEAKILHYVDGMYTQGAEYKKYSKSHVIIFHSSKEMEVFRYLHDRDLFNIKLANPLEEFDLLTLELKKKYGVSNLDVADEKFITAVNDATARKILNRLNIIDLKETENDISYGILEFQKMYKLPISGRLTSKTIVAIEKQTRKGLQNQERIERALFSINQTKIDNAVWSDYLKQNNFDNSYEKLHTLYLTPRPPEILKTKVIRNIKLEEEDLKQKINYLEYLAKKGFISSDKNKWTNLEVDKGIFKFQTGKGLKKTGEFDALTVLTIKEETPVSKNKYFIDNKDGTFIYENKNYSRFNEIPFQNSDILSFDRSLKPEEATHLMKRGVKFVYNNPAYLRQKDKQFKIVYLISNDIPTVKKLYAVDESNANKLIKYSASLLSNKSIIKASSFDEMIIKQNEILKNNQVPVLIFHNSVAHVKLNSFNSKSNIITCNSFSIKPDAYLTSTDLLDMEAIIEGLSSSYQNATLQEFYSTFTARYYSYMKQKHQQTTLIYLGGGTVIGGGIYTIAFYNPK